MKNPYLLPGLTLLAGVIDTMVAKQLAAVAVFSLLSLGSVNAATGDPTARLRAARSLRCTFTSTAAIWVRNGHRIIEQTHDKGTAAYDNIDVLKVALE